MKVRRRAWQGREVPLEAGGVAAARRAPGRRPTTKLEQSELVAALRAEIADGAHARASARSSSR